MTILPYIHQSRKHCQQQDDASTSLGSNSSSTSGGKTEATEPTRMCYSEDEDDVSLCYSDASSTVTPPVPAAIEEGFVVEATADECSVLSLDHSYISSPTAPPNTNSYLLDPNIAAPEAPSMSHQDVSCKKLQQSSPKIQERKGAAKEKHDAAAKPCDRRTPSIGMGPSEFRITCVLKQGWLYKRGTGGDVLGREGWKRRYAFLALATNRQTRHAIEVPVLLIFRNDSSTMPSNLIPLDSAVVMAMPSSRYPDDAETKGTSPKQCFDVIQAKKSRFFSDDVALTSAIVASRSFAASKDEANAWVDKINTALLQFEKRKAQAGALINKYQIDKTKLSQLAAGNFCLDVPTRIIYKR
jgi:hypothetical protein